MNFLSTWSELCVLSKNISAPSNAMIYHNSSLSNLIIVGITIIYYIYFFRQNLVTCKIKNVIICTELESTLSNYFKILLNLEMDFSYKILK